jgi:glycosyltransferase involved in cell wall biosynthesis
MLFYCYSEVTDSTIEARLGDADYSYYFVLKAYVPLLEKIGSVQIVESLDNAFAEECQKSLDNGVACYLLVFAPPHKIPYELPCPVIPVFAWEYSSIPNREFISDPKDSWCNALNHFGQALTHSSYAKHVVKRDMQETDTDFSIESIPAPLWDSWETLRDQASVRKAVKDCSITFQTTVIDSYDFAIDSESIAPSKHIARPFSDEASSEGMRNNIQIEFGESNPDVWMVGFYPAEPWGAWSKNSNPWIMLPSVVSGKIRLKISLNAYGKNVGRAIQMKLGELRVNLKPTAKMSELEFELDVVQPSNFISFSNIDLSANRTPTDPRTIGIGLGSISIESLDLVTENLNKAPKENIFEHSIKLSGVVYTSIFNPRDGRKNWEDILTAFCLAFRDHTDVTLIFKMTYKDMSGYLEDVFALLCQLHPFQCRVVVIHGYLQSGEYTSLIGATSYIVNASRSEGQCLPLMEYMSSGIPAIAPDNTAMADYVNESNSFIVASSPEPHYWPHDPQQIFTTLWYRPSWESLHAAYLESYKIATQNPDIYSSMSRHAYESQYHYCSREKLKIRLESFLKGIREK